MTHYSALPTHIAQVANASHAAPIGVLNPNDYWQAALQLNLQYAAGKTRLAAGSHYGPLRVQRPFYPEGPQRAHIYLLHPPGGMVAGDHLEIDVALSEEAEALITTPSAGKFYNNVTQKPQRQATRIRLAENAALDWLPQETIVFDGARGSVRTQVELSGHARFCGWEIVCLGRPASQLPFKRGHLAQRFEIYRDGQALWIENNRLDADAPVFHGRAGFQGQAVYGTLALVGKTFAQLDLALGELIRSNALISSTRKNDLTLVRYLGASTEECRNLFALVWRSAYQKSGLAEPAIPRIWHT